MYLTVGHFRFTAEGAGRASELMAQIQSLGRQEPGVQQYTFYPAPDVPHGYLLFEEWDSQADHDAHFNRAEIQGWLPEFFGLLAEPPSVSYFEATLSSKL